MASERVDAVALSTREGLTLLAKADPAPPFALDSPAKALQRRWPGSTIEECAALLRELYADGFVTITAPLSTVSAGLTQHPESWITAAGWRALRAGE